MEGQREAWDSFYSANARAWRGVSDIKGHPFAKGSHILEVGCGNGKTASALKDEGMTVTAIDFSSAVINSCQPAEGIKYICASVTELPFDDCSFDGVLAFHVIEHLDEDELPIAVSEMERVLRPGSFLMVKVFSRDDMRSDKGDRIGDGTVVRGNGIMYHYYTEDELERTFSSMETIEVRTVTDMTRFGEARSRIMGVFRKRKDQSSTF